MHTARVIDLKPALPARWWLGGLLLALWPHAHWVATRWADGSDDPLGMLALGVLAAALWRTRHHWRATPQTVWLASALTLLVLATLAWALRAPPLVSALLGAVSLGVGVGAVRAPRQAALPLLGLAVLGLPVIASMQFYAGFPLRVLTAEASAWLLRLGGWTVEVSGTALTVAGRLVIVDAPCSGVQMVWLAYFSACTAALWRGVPDGRFARRLATVGAAVMLGNVLRNSALVALEVAWPEWADRLHQPIGLVVLGAVCAGVWTWMGRDAGPEVR